MTIFTDAATVPSVTTPSGVDVAADVESATVSSKSTPSAVEIKAHDYPDSATITSVTLPTFGEVYTAAANLPPFILDVALTSPTVITLTYNKLLASNNPTTSFYTVIDNAGTSYAVSSAVASGMTVVLTLATAIPALKQPPRVTYTPV